MSHLRRRYGYFCCPECDAEWESSHVYCDGYEAVYEQDCKECDTACLPYKVEKLICSMCGNRDCTCTEEDKMKRNVDANKPHRADLCHKCKSGKPC